MICGADKILAEIADRKLVTRKLVGLNLAGKGPPHVHDALLNEDGDKIGEVTSGVFGPTAGHARLWVVEKKYAKKGTSIKCKSARNSLT